MNKCDCANCVCLVEGINGEWVCDEVNKNIENIKHCPEELVCTNAKLVTDGI